MHIFIIFFTSKHEKKMFKITEIARPHQNWLKLMFKRKFYNFFFNSTHFTVHLQSLFVKIKHLPHLIGNNHIKCNATFESDCIKKGRGKIVCVYT